MNGNGAAVDFNPRSPRGERQGFAVEFLLDDISIHAPLAGSDMGVPTKVPGLSVFQSTLPSRGATDYFTTALPAPQFQSTLPSRGATVNPGVHFNKDGDFNPRSPRGERLRILTVKFSVIRFQSTLPSRGATNTCIYICQYKKISIHAPLAGSDSWLSRCAGKPSKFQSTLPSRGATKGRRACGHDIGISIHAPLAGSDSETAQRHRYVL